MPHITHGIFGIILTLRNLTDTADKLFVAADHSGLAINHSKLALCANCILAHQMPPTFHEEAEADCTPVAAGPGHTTGTSISSRFQR
jgi:hypothetical protein